MLVRNHQRQPDSTKRFPAVRVRAVTALGALSLVSLGFAAVFPATAEAAPDNCHWEILDRDIVVGTTCTEGTGQFQAMAVCKDEDGKVFFRSGNWVDVGQISYAYCQFRETATDGGVNLQG